MLFFWKTLFSGFLSLHDDMYVEILINDLKLVASNFIVLSIKHHFQLSKMFSGLHRFRFRRQKKLVASTRSEVTWYFEGSELASLS